MPKRKRSDSEYERIKKKLKKLERKLERKHRRSSSSSVASTGSQEDNQDVFLESGIEKDLLYDLRTDIEAPPGTQLLEIEDELTTVPEAPQQQPTTTLTSALLSEPTAVTTAETQEAIVADLDEVALEILGVDPSVPISHVKDVQKDLAIRFDYLASSGLDKSLRKELLEKYLPPGNCYSINAPILNPEIKAALTEVVIKRDKAFFDKQKQTASVISSLSQAITLMLQKDDKDPVLLKTLMDTGRLLCDSQYSESITRRNFILPVLKKELRTQLQQTKIDKFLFSEKLSDALKTAKAIHQSGAELKLPSNFKPLFRKPKPGPIKNWKGPPLNRRSAPPRAQPSGTSRTTQPAQTKPQRWQSSKGSQQTSFNNRR